MSTTRNPSPSPSSIDITEASPSPDPLTEDQLSALEIHNLAHSEVQVPPLSWSSSLAQEAQTWAEHLAGPDLGHRKGRLRMRDPGTNENVTVCLRDPPFRDPLSAAARRIYGEKERWPCRFSRAAGGEGRIARECGGRCEEVHMQYTQMVWRDTTLVGMGCATNRVTGHQYIVARFWPSGNVVGEAPY